MKGWVCRLLILRAEVSEKSAITTLPTALAFLLLGCWLGESWLHLAAAPSSEGRAWCRDPGQDGDISHPCVPPTSQQQTQPAVRRVSKSPYQKAYSLIGKTELIIGWTNFMGNTSSLYILSCCPELAADTLSR